jgi:hypothetical protein
MSEQNNHPSTALVPFGKYRGQPVAVLRNDPEYLQWVMGQDWFRARYANIYQLIVNNFGAPAETPEHNALQVRFLDLEFCRGLLRVLGWRPIFDGLAVMREWREEPLRREWDILHKELDRAQTACAETTAKLAQPTAAEPPDDFDWQLVDPPPPRRTSPGKTDWTALYASTRQKETAEQRTARWLKAQTNTHSYLTEDLTRDEAQIARAKQRLAEIETELAQPLSLPFIKIKQPTFEVDGWDVKFEATAAVDTPATLNEESATLPDRSPYARNSIDYRIPVTTYWRTQYSSHYSITIRVELKTALGDDYPAVLRQMKANRGQGSYDRDILLVDRFTAAGATREQVKAVFAASQFTVLGLAAVEAAYRQLHRPDA